MSRNDNIREKPLKKRTKTWFLHQAKLIFMISKYPVIYIPAKQRRVKSDKVKWDDAWTEISSKLNQPILGCKQLWKSILFKYAKIMSLINTGRITKMAAMSHPETVRFFDGRLSFMDPYLCEIGDEKIPFQMHKMINKIFHLKTKLTPKTSKTSNIKPDKAKKLFITHAQVKALLKKRELKEKKYSDTMDTKSLQIVIDTAVKSKLEELLQINLSNSYNDIVNNDDENAVNVQSKSDVILIPSDEENTSECITKRHLGLQNEHSIKDNKEIDHEDDQIMEDDEQRMEDDEQMMENDEQSIEDDVDYVEMNDKDFNINREDEDDVDNIQINDEDFNIRVVDDGVRLENLVIDKNINNETLDNLDLEKMPIIIPGACTILGNINDDISDAHIRNFFSQLGEVMSLELNISKQNILKSRINELLISMLRN